MEKLKFFFSNLGIALATLGFFAIQPFESLAQSDAAIYEACPGTEIALHFQS
jgi:hypothetical protein